MASVVVADPAGVRSTVKRRPGRVDASFYDRSDYFESGAKRLADLETAFQRYRVAKVLQIYDPLPEERVVDLGCGWGTFEWVLAARVAEIVGVDFSRKSVEFCQRRKAALGLANARFVHADAAKTGLAAASFDLAVAADLFEHLYPDDSVRVAAEARRLLRPGGRFSIWTPHRGHLIEVLKNRGIVLRPDPTHVDYKSMDRLRGLLEGEGFVLEKAYYAESHLPGLRSVERALMASVPLMRRRIAILARKT